MAEFDFILGARDQSALVKHLLATDAILVPFLAYLSPACTAVDDADALTEMNDMGMLYGPVFVTWPGAQRYPYQYDEVQRPEGRRYFLGQREAGPYMAFNMCRTLDNQEKPIITSGFIAYYSRYWIEEIGQELPVCDELKRQYVATTAFLRSISIKAKSANRTYWVGKQAAGLLRGGYQPSVEGLELPVLA